MVYFAYFNSILQYGIEFWGNSSFATSTFILQKKAIRSLCNLSPFESCRTYFQKLKILTVTNLYIFRLCILIYENRNTLASVSDRNPYSVRDRKKIEVPKYNLRINRKGPLYSGIDIFNKIPEEIKNNTTMNSFKQKLKRFLLTNVFYSLTEFNLFLASRTMSLNL